ncbi:MAG TPA: RsmD family RNA methyltransferase [Candidatus Dojkabacteria bacterium]|nr:RsmD family RNA methyltransferase [Candidatus Dojkabacteria bacterium]
MSLKIDSFKKLRKEKNKWKTETWEEYEDREKAFLKERLLSKEPTIKGQVRITAGSAKNVQIDIPRTTRPLTDRMKVRVFDILNTDIVNKEVLDLYAGSGSFGLEALSRGAKNATFVDAAKQAFGVLENNAKATGFSSSSEVIKMKVEEYLFKKTTEGNVVFDIIFMDPPYKLFNKKKMFNIEKVLNDASKLLPAVQKIKGRFKGAIIVKHPRRYPIEKLKLDNIKAYETFEFGLNCITIYIVK